MQVRITEYTVVKAGGLRGLAAQVNELIIQGWQPQGGVGIHKSGHYFQALVRYGKEAA